MIREVGRESISYLIMSLHCTVMQHLDNSAGAFWYIPHSSKIMSQLFFFNFLAKKTEFGRVYKPKQEFR